MDNLTPSDATFLLHIIKQFEATTLSGGRDYYQEERIADLKRKLDALQGLHPNMNQF